MGLNSSAMHVICKIWAICFGKNDFSLRMFVNCVFKRVFRGICLTWPIYESMFEGSLVSCAPGRRGGVFEPPGR